MSQGLVDCGLSVDIATTDDNGRGRLDVPLDAPVVENGVIFHYFPRQMRLYTVSWPLWRWLAAHAAEYDLIHIHALFSFASVAGAFWARRKGVPYLVRPLGVLNTWGIRNRRPLLKRLSLALVERRILANAAATHFTCEQEKLEAELAAPSARAVVIPNPVTNSEVDARADSSVFLSRYPELAGKRIVLFLSRVDEKKGLDLLLDAFAKVREQAPDAVLVIAGNGEVKFVERLQDQARRLGLQSHVIWAGFLDGEAKQSAFAAADVFVLPSYSENFGNAVVEAMASGVPALVSDQVGLHCEIANAGAGRVTACDGGEVGGALCRMLDDPEMRARMGGNARVLARKFSPEVVSQQLLAAYRNFAGPRPAPDLSAIVLTHNEEANLPSCLGSLRLLGRPIFVVDSGSTDRTREIAAQHGATILEHPFATHTQQWDWALANVPVKTEWILALDADQAITPELAREIRTGLATSACDGLYIKRRQVFRGRWIKHGGYYPKYLLKLFRREKIYLNTNEAVDHHFYVRGACKKLRHDLIEANHKEDDISFWIEKHNRYAALMAQEEYRKRDADNTPITASMFGTPDQRTLWLKRLWSRLPLFVRPALYFTYRYFLRAGFLDGKEGFIFHFLQAYWYRLLVDIKLDEIRNPASKDSPPRQRKAPRVSAPHDALASMQAILDTNDNSRT